MHTCLKHLRKCIPHSAFGNKPGGRVSPISTCFTYALASLSLQLICKEAPSPTLQRAVAVFVLCGHSVNSKVFGKEPCCTNEILLNYSFQHPARKKKCRVSRPHITMSSWSSLGWIFGRLYTTGIILTMIPVGHYYFTL